MSIRLRSLGIRVIPKKPDYDCSRAHFEHFLLRHPERLSDVIPNVSEESTAWMLHFAYAPFSMTGAEAMSFRAVVRNPLMDASLCLRFVQHDRRCYAKHLCHSGHRVMAGTFCVIPSAARNPLRGCFTSFSAVRRWRTLPYCPSPSSKGERRFSIAETG